MAALAPQAREILVWRTGLGTGRAEGRLQVARLLGTSVPRERSLEQRAAAQLRRTAAPRGCELSASLAATLMIPTAVSAGLDQALQPLAAPPPAAPALASSALAPPALAGRASSSRAPAPGAAAAHRSRSASRAHRSPSGQPGAAENSKPRLQDSGSGSPSLLLIALAVVGAAILLTPLARKFMPHAWSAGTQSDPVEPSRAPATLAAGAEPPRAETAAAGAAGAAGAAAGVLDQPSEPEDELAASSRADLSGDPEGAFAVGCLLVERGDLGGAVAAYRRAAERGHPSGASNLGVLLEQQGDVDGALDAYRAAAERGDPQGAFNLGGLLAERGDLSGAVAAYAQAEECGDADVAEAARSVIDELKGQGSA